MQHHPGPNYEKPTLARSFNVWVDIHAPIELVFKFLTEETSLNRWWANRCKADPRPGGVLECVWEGETATTGKAIFTRFEPPRHLVIEWIEHDGEAIEGNGSDRRGMRWPARNIFELTLLDGNLTRVYLHDMGIAHGETYASISEATANGWLTMFARLKKVAEQHFRQTIMTRHKKMIEKKVSPAENDSAPLQLVEPEEEAD